MNNGFSDHVFNILCIKRNHEIYTLYMLVLLRAQIYRHGHGVTTNLNSFHMTHVTCHKKNIVEIQPSIKVILASIKTKFHVSAGPYLHAHVVMLYAQFAHILRFPPDLFYLTTYR